MKMIRIIVVFVLILSGFAVFGQQKLDCAKVLDQEPYFVKHKTLEKDSMLLRDIRILKECGQFAPEDSVFLKGPMLGALLLDQVRLGKPATYRTLIDYFAAFKKTIAYKDFLVGLKLYQVLSDKKVNLENWKEDQELFVRIGFTTNDLDDFRQFLADQPQANLTYREALTAYMRSMEALRIDK